MRGMLAIVWIMAAAPAFAQDESALHAEFRREGQKVRESCGKGLKGVGSCAVTLATEHPLHVAFGSLAPKSGFGVGAALVGHHTPNRNWRLTWNGDGVASPGGSWRTGAYVTFVRTAVKAPIVISSGAPATVRADDSGEYPMFTVFTQATSLNELRFFGLGPNSSRSAESVWGLKETLIGGNALVPVRSGPLGLSVLGGVTARLIDVRSVSGPLPSAGSQPTFTQFTGGVRLRPSLFGGHLQPTYTLSGDALVASSDAVASFSRWTLDLAHVIPFYRTGRPGTSVNGPDGCGQSVDSAECPSVSRDRDGGITLRVLTIASTPRSGGAVPFYLQPTLGGSDINGTKLLGGFDDYRFRGPNLIALQESIDHSLWRFLGVFAMAEQGKVALGRADLNLSGLVRSYTAGLTVRAGGFPQLYLLYGWGNEGHHIGATVNSSLLGGSARPSLF